jgi:acyl-coenzyme A synthetase/AMP-(fatty) acid ligase
MPNNGTAMSQATVDWGIPKLPRNALGKIQKVALREDYRNICASGR